MNTNFSNKAPWLPQADIMAVYTELGKTASRLTDKLTREYGIVHAWSLSPIDLTVAIQNAYCPHECFIIPPLKVGPTVSSIPVTAQDNSIIFSHVLHTCEMQGNKAAVDQILSQGFISISRDMHVEYIDALLAVSRLFHTHSETFLGEAIDIVAGVTYLDLIRYGQPSLAPHAPMISVNALRGSHIEFTYLRRQEHIRLKDHDTIYIPGAGLSTLSNMLTISADRNHRIILNDKNPFVAWVLRKVAQYMGANNVTVLEWDFSDIRGAENNSIGLMILSLLHNAGPESMAHLAKNSYKMMREWWEIVVFNPALPPSEGDLGATELSSIFEASWFHKKRRNPIRYDLAGEIQSKNETVRILTKATSEEIIQLLSDKLTQKSNPRTTNGEFMVFGK